MLKQNFQVRYILFQILGRYEDTLLHAVAERGHSSIFKLILNEVNNKNPKGHFADTPLHFASERGHIGKSCTKAMH